VRRWRRAGGGLGEQARWFVGEKSADWFGTEGHRARLEETCPSRQRQRIHGGGTSCGRWRGS